MIPLDKQAERLQIYYRDGGICQYCGRPVGINEFQLAHRIARTKWAVRKYGWEVIEHPLNKLVTHAGRCNDGVLITYRPVQREELVAKIREAIANHG